MHSDFIESLNVRAKARLARAEENLRSGVYDSLNETLYELAQVGSIRKKLRKSQKRKIKKLAKKANKELT